MKWLLLPTRTLALHEATALVASHWYRLNATRQLARAAPVNRLAGLKPVATELVERALSNQAPDALAR